jgi:hypothetical protein
MFKYFIAYEYQTATTKGKTNAVIEMARPISSINEINSIQAEIIARNPGYTTAVILNIVRLED